MDVVESDICILGSGISGVLVARKLSHNNPKLKIVLVEAGKEIFDLENRLHYRERHLKYIENPWPGDYVKDQIVTNAESQTMAAGGWALHWEGHCTRYSEEDLRLKSLYGLAVDWPLSWQEMERHYVEAERAIGVSGEESPYLQDKRSAPYPMPGMPLSYSLKQVKEWAELSGLKFTASPVARNSTAFDGRPQCERYDTCSPICPIGARYSPDFTLRKMLQDKQVELYSNVMIRRLQMAKNSDRIEDALGVDLLRPERKIKFKAKIFVLAMGKYWSPHLLLLSSNSRFPSGLANRSGWVGKGMSGFGTAGAMFKIPSPLFEGMHDSGRIESREFFRCPTDKEYLRHLTGFSVQLKQDLAQGRSDRFLVGDELFKQWKDSGTLASLFVRFDLHAAPESGITLDPARRNKWGDPMPHFNSVLDQKTQDRHPLMMDHFSDLCERFIAKGKGGLVEKRTERLHVWKSRWNGGGCNLAKDPEQGVCDSFGRTFDHENLFVVGPATLPTVGIGGLTLAGVALGLRSADEILRVI